MEKTKQRRTVVIPSSMATNIEAVIAGRLGYVTIAEYVRNAVRDKLNLDLLRLEDFKLEEKMKKDLGNDEE